MWRGKLNRLMRRTKGYTKSVEMLVYSLALVCWHGRPKIHYPLKLRIPSLVFVLEWSVRMIFWALAQRKKDREKIEAAARADERERIVREMEMRGIEIPPDILEAPPVRK